MGTKPTCNCNHKPFPYVSVVPQWGECQCHLNKCPVTPMPHGFFFYTYATSTNCGHEATHPRLGPSLRGLDRGFQWKQRRLPVTLDSSIVCLLASSQGRPLRCTLVLPARLSGLCLGGWRKFPLWPHFPRCQQPWFFSASVWRQVLTLINLFLVLQMNFCGDGIRGETVLRELSRKAPLRQEEIVTLSRAVWTCYSL